VAFADEQSRKDLEAITHPAIQAEFARRVLAAPADAIVVLDVPLLVESGRDDLAGLIVVDTDPDIAVQRLVDQRGFREADARARIARQASREERLARADFVISNDGTRDDLEEQVDECWDWISRLLPR
jgi:dephospho-CoA kinase